MCDFFDWLCKKTGHLIRREWENKSNGTYQHCQICGQLIEVEE